MTFTKKKKSIFIAGLAGVIGIVCLTKYPTDFRLTHSIDYVLTLNSSNRPDSKGVIKLLSGNERTLFSSGLTEYQGGWCSLASNGYFGLNNTEANRIGDLTSLEYTISGDLQIEYGWIEFNNVNNYVDTLKASEHVFNFSAPSSTSKPDIFKITNLGNETINITSMAFSYLCTQLEPSIDNAKIKIGTTSVDLVEYTPKTATNYNLLGSLKFEQNSENNGGFVLSLNNSDSTKSLYVDVSSYDASSLCDFRIDVTGDNAVLNNVTFVGNHNASFTGKKLTIKDGQTLFNCKNINVKNSLDFQGETNASSLTAVSIISGQLKTSSSSTINIDGYRVGINFAGNEYGSGFDQNGVLTISNVSSAGVKADYNSGSFWFNGTTTISSTQYPVQIANTSDTSAQSVLYVKSGTHNWSATGSGKTALSVGKLVVGDTNNAPILNISTNGGKGLSDASSTGVDTYEFYNGTTTISDTNNGQTDNYGICNYGKNAINIHSKAILNINNFATGIVSNSDVSTINDNGEMNINGATLYGMFDTSLVVGGSNENAKARVQVSTNRSTTSKRVACIKINEWESIKVKTGFLLCHSTAWEYTQGILLDCDFSSNRLSIESGAKLGFGVLQYGLNIGGNTYSGTFSSAVVGEYHEYAVQDNAWNSVNKISTTSKNNKTTFNSIFGTNY